MPLKAVFFDLDGSLLPMDQSVFIKSYFSSIAAKMKSFGFEPDVFTKGLWAGIDAMVKNNGVCTNEEAFWKAFSAVLGPSVKNHETDLRDFYANEFQQIQQVCGYDPKAARLVRWVRQSGMVTVLATNPVFPSIATESRIRWAGLDKEDFDYYTVYENSRYSKPNPKYYQAILDHLGLNAEDVLMVGNDVSDDMAAESVGIKVFLLTHSLINKDNEDINRWPHGGYDDLFSYLKNMVQ